MGRWSRVDYRTECAILAKKWLKDAEKLKKRVKTDLPLKVIIEDVFEDLKWTLKWLESKD
jgi:hypothetical protein